MDKVPLIDFSAYSLDRESPDPERFQKLIDEVHQALTTIGFMYLKNVGIPIQKIKDAYSSSMTFYSLPGEEKHRYAGPKGINMHGYQRMEEERSNPDVHFKDLKEVFNYCPAAGEKTFPEDALPEFKSSLIELFNAMVPLNLRVMEVVARGLKLQDPHFFQDKFKLAGTSKSHTTLRSAYYPSLEGVEIKEGQLRCGEHTDFGGITLLIQNNPGLEVKTVDNNWVPAPPIEGTVVVNIGDLMQRWTSDILVANKHRVAIQSDQMELDHDRQSLVFFGYPDNDVIIECTDESSKYPPIESTEYLLSQLQGLHAKNY
ncbi:proline hydroxylase buaE-like [Lytechinus variegatus]|uniref:proline hydroxylase buaE-like n=1 Tax=Lytechinus variegatus TaxID=7654 RepID=UPI001BB18C8F|nr:proline hydroxylase buaE-like [Lytechinus variegatus]